MNKSFKQIFFPIYPQSSQTKIQESFPSVRKAIMLVLCRNIICVKYHFQIYAVYDFNKSVNLFLPNWNHRSSLDFHTEFMGLILSTTSRLNVNQFSFTHFSKCKPSEEHFRIVIMVCGNHFGRQDEEPQTKECTEKRQLSPQQECGQVK